MGGAVVLGVVCEEGRLYISALTCMSCITAITKNDAAVLIIMVVS